MSKSLRVFAPATVANVCSGFDLFGFALNTPGDEIILTLSNKPGVRIAKITGDNETLPKDPLKNTASVAVLHMLKALKTKQGADITIHKRMPLGSGLGSSAASAAGAVFALNEILGRPLEKHALIPFAMQGECAACGAPHADNVAPALLGGFTLIRSYAPLDVVSIPLKKNWYAAIFHPQVEISTAYARKLLPKTIPLKTHIAQSGNAAGLITGLLLHKKELIQRSMEDFIAEPLRSKLIPKFAILKQAALEAGALGFGISGSGPSVFALCTTKQIAEQAAAGMQAGVSYAGDCFVSAMNRKGVHIS